MEESTFFDCLFSSLLNRAIVLGLGIFFHNITQDYDLSATNSTFIKWDSVYFVSIAKRGYYFEHELAFYPGFPLVIRLFKFLFPFLDIEFISLFLPSLFYVFSSFLLYQLTLKIGYNKEFAIKTVKIFSISPISIFTFAPYTESLFTFLTLIGTLLWIYHLDFLAFVVFFISCFVRSNGILLSGFFLYNIFKIFVPHIKQVHNLRDSIQYIFNLIKNQKINLNINAFKSINLKYILKNLIFSLLILIIPQYIITKYSNYLFCPNVSEWCGKSPYSYIQRKYWNVGFLRFWRVDQIPNILLVFPIVYFSLKYIFQKTPIPYLAFPFVIHLLALLIFSLLFAHVNVTTRLLFAACPASWWSLASASFNSKLPIIYCASYFIIGIALFTNFLPWT